MSIVWPCPLTVDAYALMGRAVRVPRPECPSCSSPVVFWSGYWRHVRCQRRERKIFIPRVRWIIPAQLSAVSAMIRVICAASAHGARGRTSCKRVANATPNLMLALLRLVPQCSLTRSYGSGGELCEVGGSSPVDFRHRVGVVPQCGRSAAAVAKTRCGVTQVKPRREQLACRVVPQPFDIELDAGRGRQVAGLMRGPVGIPRPGAHRVIREHVGVLG